MSLSFDIGKEIASHDDTGGRRRDAGDPQDLERGSDSLSDLARLCRGALALLAATIICVAVATPAAAETRSLKLYFLHTKERATITYKKNGRYIPSGLKKLNTFLRDWRRNEPTKMDPRLFDLLWEVYQATGAKKHIHVVSAYRSPQTNAMLRKRSKGVARRSQHTLGRAIDFYIPDVKLSKLRRIAMQAQVGGVGYYPRSGSPFVHLDVGNVRSWPRMSRKELATVFPDGKTLHLPTDGKPLPGYKQAMADYKERVSATEIRVAGKRSSGGNLLAGLFRGGNRDKDEEVKEEAPVRVARRQTTQREARPVAPRPSAVASLAYVPTPQPRPTPDDGGVALVQLPVEPAPTQVALAPAIATTVDQATASALAPARSDSDSPSVPIPIAADRGVQFGARIAAAQTPLVNQPVLLAPASLSADGAAELQVAAIQTPAVNPLTATTDPPAGLAFVPRPTIRPNATAAEGLVIAAAYAPEPVVANDVPTIVDGIPIPTPSPLGAVSEPAQSAPSTSVEVALAPASASSPRGNSIIESAFAPLVRHNRSKRSRPDAGDAAKSRPASIRTEPVVTQKLVTDRAFATSRIEAMQGPGIRPDFVSAYLRSAPDTVHLVGFSTDHGAIVADQFSGRAVNFLTVARFVPGN